MPVFEAANVEEEAPITAKWITDAVKEHPWARYGKQQFSVRFFDPRSQTEDLGDDVVKATRYGVKNLKTLIGDYDKWITSGDDDFEFRTEILEGIINQMAMYIQHVYLNVGGLYKNEVKADDTLPAFANIPTEKQVAALKYMFELYGDLDWLDNRELMNKLAIMGSPKAAVANMLGGLIISAPFSVSLSADVAGNSFSFRDCADIVYDFIWKPTVNGRKLTREQMDIQKQYVEQMMGSRQLPAAQGLGKRLCRSAARYDRLHLQPPRREPLRRNKLRSRIGIRMVAPCDLQPRTSDRRRYLRLRFKGSNAAQKPGGQCSERDKSTL